MLTAIKIIIDPSVKFTHPYDFNDPFEVSSLIYKDHRGSIHDMTTDTRHIAINMCYGVLSLSRSPLNPLMWAHYATGKKAKQNDRIELGLKNKYHCGFVIGINIDDAGLNSESDNVIPAKYGSVIYTKTKPMSLFDNSDDSLLYDGLLCYFSSEHLEALQRTFLYKSSCWSYEEEVRIVRNLHRTGSSEIQSIDKGSIRQIYIGSGHYGNRSFVERIKNKILRKLPDCDIYLCRLDDESWDIKAEKI